MAKTQNIGFNLLYFLLNNNNIKVVSIYENENLLGQIKAENTDELINSIKIFENKLLSGVYIFKCKVSDGATNEFLHCVQKNQSFDEIDNSKNFIEKTFESDLEKKIRKQIEIEQKEEYLEIERKKLFEKNKKLDSIANQGFSIVEKVGTMLIEKYSYLFFPNQVEVDSNVNVNDTINDTVINSTENFTENRNIDTLFTIEEQNKLTEILINNELYLSYVKNMLK